MDSNGGIIYGIKLKWVGNYLGQKRNTFEAKCLENVHDCSDHSSLMTAQRRITQDFHQATDGNGWIVLVRGRIYADWQCIQFRH
jgi:hypothetical protein